MLHWIFAIFAFSMPNPIFKIFHTHPNDPSLSCYQLKNSSWVCVQDIDLKDDFEFDPENSY